MVSSAEKRYLKRRQQYLQSRQELISAYKKKNRHELKSARVAMVSVDDEEQFLEQGASLTQNAAAAQNTVQKQTNQTKARKVKSLPRRIAVQRAEAQEKVQRFGEGVEKSAALEKKANKLKKAMHRHEGARKYKKAYKQVSARAEKARKKAKHARKEALAAKKSYREMKSAGRVAVVSVDDEEQYLEQGASLTKNAADAQKTVQTIAQRRALEKCTWSDRLKAWVWPSDKRRCRRGTERYARCERIFLKFPRLSITGATRCYQLHK